MEALEQLQVTALTNAGHLPWMKRPAKLLIRPRSVQISKHLYKSLSHTTTRLSIQTTPNSYPHPTCKNT